MSASHPRLGVVAHKPSDVRTIQNGASAGNPAYTYYVNPIKVLFKNLPRHGFTGPFQVFPRIVIGVTYRTRTYDIYLVQPYRSGVGGIWVINRILPHGVKPSTLALTPTPAPTPGAIRPHLGIVTHLKSTLLAIQAGADAHNPAYTFYLNPVQVVARTLSKYGFVGPFTIVPRLTVRVYYQGPAYDVVLTQPAKHGPQGVWLITAITRHTPV